MNIGFMPEDYLEQLDPAVVHVAPLPDEKHKLPDPWQMLWEVKDPEDRFFGFVVLNEGTGATPSSSVEASQFDFVSVVKAGVMKAREINESQNFDRDKIYIVNAARTTLARIVLPKDEVLPFFKLGSTTDGAVFYE